MKRNFNIPVVNYDGRPYVRPVYKFDAAGVPITTNGMPEVERHEPMTLRLYALDALAGRWRGEEGMSIEESHKRFQLLQKISAAGDGDVDLDGAETQMILTALKNQGRDHTVVGRMKLLFDTDPS